MPRSRVAPNTASSSHIRSVVWATLLAALVFACVLGAVATPPVLAEEGVRDPQVVGGRAVPNGKYGFVTAVLDKRNGNTVPKQQFCGGTLIDRNSVLTAAHCVRGKSPRVLRVAVGRTALDSNQGQIRNVAQVRQHPNYNANTYAYDAAVLNLSRPVTGIAPIRLSTSRQNGLETPGRRLTVAGWGNVQRQSPGGPEPDSYPKRMREAQVPVVSDSRADRTYTNYVPALMVAAGKTGKDTCQGDSGGPMFARTGGGYTQVGITSFGIGCASPGFPGVYAEVNNQSIRGFIVNAAN